jgi:membrane-associated protease RseP (regulator of RpoE activity)
LQRAYLPLEIYPISAGVKGGLAGSVAMAVVAMLYGIDQPAQHLVSHQSAGRRLSPGAMTDTTAKIAAFNLSVFLIATAIHLITSLLVGLLYGAMLPMLPRRPILLGGFIAPLFWTGLIHSILGIVNPCSTSAFTGSGSWLRKWRLGLSRASLFHGRNAYARGSACRWPTARAWKLRD